MIILNGTEQFRLPLDRNGSKIHIGEYALLLSGSCFIRCQVIGFSENYKFVYLFGNHSLYKRMGHNIVIVHQLNKWENNERY